MKVLKVSSREGDELMEYKSALKRAKKGLKMAKESIESICELTEDMEDEFSLKGAMQRMRRRKRSSEEDEWDDE